MACFVPTAEALLAEGERGWVDGVIRGDLLDRLAATDRLHGDSGLEFGTVGAALAHEWETPFQGRYPASEVNDGTCPEKPDQLNLQPPLFPVPEGPFPRW